MKGVGTNVHVPHMNHSICIQAHSHTHTHICMHRMHTRVQHTRTQYDNTTNLLFLIKGVGILKIKLKTSKKENYFVLGSIHLGFNIY